MKYFPTESKFFLISEDSKFETFFRKACYMPRLRSEVYNQTSRFYTLENLTPNDFRHFIVDEKSKLIYCALSKERFYENPLIQNHFLVQFNTEYTLY